MTILAGLRAWVEARDDVSLGELGQQPQEQPTVFIRISGGDDDPSGILIHYDLHAVLARRDRTDVTEDAGRLAIRLVQGLRASDLPVAVTGISGLDEWDDPNPRAESDGWWSITISTETLTAFEYVEPEPVVPPDPPAGDSDMTRIDTLLDAAAIASDFEPVASDMLTALAFPAGTDSLDDFDVVAIVAHYLDMNGDVAARADARVYRQEITAAAHPGRVYLNSTAYEDEASLDLTVDVDLARDGTYAVGPFVFAPTDGSITLTVLGIRYNTAPA